MSRLLPVLAVLLGAAGPVSAEGILIPDDKSVPPLAMLRHQVDITLDDQVAVTRVEQVFRNHTERPLEATYVFPIPKGASVRQFSMWVDGREVKGELVEADKARQIYTDIVRRTQDPGLLEYLGRHVMRLRIFPVPPRGDQKVALSYTSVAARDQNLVEYIYPLRTDGKATRTLEKFSLKAVLKSQHPILNVYSPTHTVSVARTTEREAVVHFEHDQALLDKDFHLYYAVGDQDVGLTTLAQRPIADAPGFFMFLISPRFTVSRSQVTPRDMVFVLDTSGSMRGPKMDQARRAMAYCVANLHPQDRFALLNFSTTVNKFRDSLADASKPNLEMARQWIDQLEPTGGTAIDDALAAALEMRTADKGRTFTVVFFTDGQPTIGETNPERIFRNVAARNTANTRIFTFGVGDDVNATLLDQLAEQTRDLAGYVRPAEDIEVKVSSLYTKISQPVLTNLKLQVLGTAVNLSEIYPPQLPDLFQGGQILVVGRYSGQGHAALKLTGDVGLEKREFVFETGFAPKTTEDRSFVEHVWARRKVGYLLDQIRLNGEKKELVDETIALAKRYGIATPYTSYLVVPDAPIPLAGGPRPAHPVPAVPPQALHIIRPSEKPAFQKVVDFARAAGNAPGGFAERRDAEGKKTLLAASKPDAGARDKEQARTVREKLEAFQKAREALADRKQNEVQTGKLGVDLSVQTNNLRNQLRLEQTAQRQAFGRNCLDVGGVWIDEGFEPSMPVLTVRAMSEGYFRLLDRHPQLREVFRLGNYLVWVAPSGTALVIDTSDGRETVSDAEIDRLFLARK